MRLVPWCVATLWFASALHAQPGQNPPTAQIELRSTSAGVVVSPCAAIPWEIAIQVGADSFGLAGYAANLVQSATNPVPIVLAPAPSVPSLLSGFSRPAGVSNTGPGGTGSGYGGTPIANQSFPGAIDLVQIGGMQNTFGSPAGNVGTDTSVEQQIGQGAQPQVVASGEFFAPSTAGSYCMDLQATAVNVLTSTGPIAGIWRVRQASVSLVQGSFCFTVRCLADVDDGSGTGVPDGGVTIDDLLYYNVIFADGDARADVDDGTSTGTCDGGVTIDDLLYFLDRFASGC